MNKEEKTELYSNIDLVLWNDWDPIGVNEEIDARDEYYGYIPAINKLLIDNASLEEITQHLHKIEKDTMCLYRNISFSEVVAKKLMKLKDNLK